LEGFGDILSNAMATLNGPQIFAPAAWYKCSTGFWRNFPLSQFN
jgi:hypothetical protein